jgi:glycosyltransferase A (GT-A) superfamily protein (DUF2064 family)
MTVIAVLAEPPRPGLVLPRLAETTPLDAADAAACYGALLRDTVRAVDTSGGDLLVNYRPDDDIPEEFVEDDVDAEAELRALVADELGGTGDVRFERQVGSTESARAGNTVTHLLREEEVRTVAVVRGTAPFLGRTLVDNAAMKLRRSGVVLGPSTRGRTYYAGFGTAVDFTDALGGLELPTLSRRAADAGVDADFLAMAPVVEDDADLRTVLPMLEARRHAGRVVPANFASFVAEVGVGVDADGDVVVDGEP